MNEVFDWREAPFAEFAVIGDPISHSRSPRMHMAAFEAMGLDHRYVAVQVTVDEVSPALSRLQSIGYWGANVTVPDKVAALEWSAKPDALAVRIGSANTLDLRDGSATNTDAPGFMDTLAPFDFREGSTALILGAGGSARAIAAVLPAAGFHVSVWNRSSDRAVMLAEEFGLVTVEAPSAGFDLVVNATSTGLGSDHLPIDWLDGKPRSLAYDLVYGDTAFLRAAADNGMRTIDGTALLVAQGARSIEWWLGVSPPIDVMSAATR